MRMSIFLLCSMFFITPALAKNVIEHGSFSQEKHFKGFSKPFISKGIFELNEEGLTWQVQSPVKSTLFIKQGQVYTLDSQGNEQLQQGAEPYVSLLRAILKHDRAALAEQFTINKSVEPNCEILLPNQALLKHVFSQFELCFDANKVTTVRLQEPNENFTLLRFSYTENEQQK